MCSHATDVKQLASIFTKKYPAKNLFGYLGGELGLIRVSES
jgi:hypothetical protein